MARGLACVVFWSFIASVFNGAFHIQPSHATMAISNINPKNYTKSPNGTPQGNYEKIEKGVGDIPGEYLHCDPDKFKHECNDLYKDSKACSQLWVACGGPSGVKSFATACDPIYPNAPDHAYVQPLSKKHNNHMIGCHPDGEGKQKNHFSAAFSHARGSPKCRTQITNKGPSGDVTGKHTDPVFTCEKIGKLETKCDWYMAWAMCNAKDAASCAVNPSSPGQTHLPFAVAKNICDEVAMSASQPNPTTNFAQTHSLNNMGALGAPGSVKGAYQEKYMSKSHKDSHKSGNRPGDAFRRMIAKTESNGMGGDNMSNPEFSTDERQKLAAYRKAYKSNKVTDGGMGMLTTAKVDYNQYANETINANSALSAVIPSYSTYDPYDYPPGAEIRMAKALSKMTEEEYQTARDLGSKMIPAAVAALPGGGGGGAQSLISSFMKVQPLIGDKIFKKQGNNYIHSLMSGADINPDTFGYDFDNTGLNLKDILNKLFGQLSQFIQNIAQQAMGSGKMHEQPEKAQEAFWESMQNLKVSDLSDSIKAVVPQNMHHMTISQLPDNIKQSVKSVVGSESINQRSPKAQAAMSDALKGLDIKSLIPNSQGGSGGSGGGANQFASMLKEMIGPVSGLMNPKFDMSDFRNMKDNPFAQILDPITNSFQHFSLPLRDRDYTPLTVGAAGPASLLFKHFMTWPGYGRGCGDVALSGSGCKGVKRVGFNNFEPEVQKKLAAAGGAAGGDTILTRLISQRYDQVNTNLLARVHYNRWCRGDGNPHGCCLKCTCPPKPCDYGVSCFSSLCWIATLPETWRGKYVGTKLDTQMLRKQVGSTGKKGINHYRTKKNRRYAQEASFKLNDDNQNSGELIYVKGGKRDDYWKDLPNKYLGRLTDIPHFAPIPKMDKDGIVHVSENMPKWVEVNYPGAIDVTSQTPAWVQQKALEQYQAGKRSSPNIYYVPSPVEGIKGITGWRPPASTRHDHGADLAFYWKDKEDSDDFYGWQAKTPWKLPRTPYAFHPEHMDPDAPRRPFCGRAKDAGADVMCDLDNGDRNPNNQKLVSLVSLARIANAPYTPGMNKCFAGSFKKAAKHGYGIPEGSSVYQVNNNNFPCIGTMNDTTKCYGQGKRPVANWTKEDHADMFCSPFRLPANIAWGKEGGGEGLVASAVQDLNTDSLLSQIPTDPNFANMPSIKLANDVLASGGGGGGKSGGKGANMCYGGMGGDTSCNKNGTGALQNASVEATAYQAFVKRRTGICCAARYERFAANLSTTGYYTSALGVPYPVPTDEKLIPNSYNEPAKKPLRQSQWIQKANATIYSSVNRNWRYPHCGDILQVDTKEGFGKGADCPWKKEIKGFDDVVKLGENAARVICKIPKGGSNDPEKGRLDTIWIVHDVMGEGENAQIRVSTTCRGRYDNAAGINEGCGLPQTITIVKKKDKIPDYILDDYKKVENLDVDPEDCSTHFIEYCAYKEWDNVVCFDPKDPDNHPRGGTPTSMNDNDPNASGKRLSDADTGMVNSLLKLVNW